MRALPVLVACLLLCAAPSAGASSFAGTLSITSVGAAGGGSLTVSASASVSETGCNSGAPAYEYCGYYPVVTTVAGSLACSPTITGSTWVGPVISSYDNWASQAFAPSWTEWPSLASGPKKACLYINASSAELLVAEVPYSVPAPGSPAGAMTTPSPGASQPAPSAGLTSDSIPAGLGLQGYASFVTSLANTPAWVSLDRWEALVGTSAKRWGLSATGTTSEPVRNYDYENQVGFGRTRAGILGVQSDLYLVRRTRGHTTCRRTWRRRSGRWRKLRVCRYVRSRIVDRQLTDQDIVLSSSYPWQAGPAKPSASEVDLQTVLLHELGHLAGNSGHVRRCSTPSPMVISLASGEWWHSPSDYYFNGDCGGNGSAAVRRPGRLIRVVRERPATAADLRLARASIRARSASGRKHR